MMDIINLSNETQNKYREEVKCFCCIAQESLEKLNQFEEILIIIESLLFSNITEEFIVKNRYQQNEIFYKIMQSEKWAIFFILSFILIIASFNIIGSLTMLIIDKQKDISILRSIGASFKLSKKIFLIEGWLISIIGAIVGLILGLLICWLQIKFGLIRLQGSGSFIIEAYPVNMQVMDFITVFITVSGIGFIAAWIPARHISKKFNLSANI